MNIAFFTSFECCPSIGGTERTTALVADALNYYYGYGVYSIYNVPVNSNVERYHFSGVHKYVNSKESQKEFIRFIKKNKISIVIVEGLFASTLQLSKVFKENSIYCRIIFALHYAPGAYETMSTRFSPIFRSWKQKKTLKSMIKALLYPFYREFFIRRSKRYYNYVENKADKIVLLSSRYIKEWQSYSNDHLCNEENKFCIIPNGLTFSHFANEEEVRSKKKKVLIVSRLDECQKKISIALLIWKKASLISEFNDWELDIVGTGGDAGLYHSIVEQFSIPRVHFHGRQNPESFYKQSAIFLMTSDYEGLPMTLLEASQFGVVPLAFETFASIYDVIENGKNGFTFAHGDTEAYEMKLFYLMRNETERIHCAMNAVENAKRFSMDKIAGMWKCLIDEQSDQIYTNP